jgi:YVTN family beta-propeller protein
VFDASGNTAFVTNFIAGTLGRVDLVARRQTDTLSLGGSAYRVLLSADGNKLFVASGNGVLRVVDPSTLSVLATIAIPSSPNGIARIGDRLYVSSASAGTITEINLATNSVARTLPIGGRPQDIAPSADGSEMYVANESGTVAVVTIATGAVAAQLPVDEGAFGLALAPDGYLYVALSKTGKVAVIDPKTRTTRATITTGGIPRRIAPDPKGTAIVVPNEGGWADILR